MSIIIVSFNVRDLLARCLESVVRQRPSRTFDVWVVDNASSDGSADMARQCFPDINVVRNEANLGFAAATNQGLRLSRGRYALLLNPDTEILAGSLDRPVAYLDSQPEVALLGCRLVYADGSFQHSCFRFPGLAQAFLDLFPLHPRLLEGRLNGRYPRAAYRQPMDVDVCLGACLMLRRTGLEFDEAYFIYVEEVDLCWRLKRAGWQIRYLPEMVVLHHAGGSTRQAPRAMRQQLFHSRRLFNQRAHGPLFRAAWEAIALAGGAPPRRRASRAAGAEPGGQATSLARAAAHQPGARSA